MKRLLFTLLFILACYGMAQANHTALHTQATALSAGQWTQVTGMTNLSGTAIEPAWQSASGSGPFYDGPQPGWNSTKKKLVFTFAEHGAGTPGSCSSGTGPDATNFPLHPHTCWTGLISYDDATSTWTTGGAYPFQQANGRPVSGSHTYGHIAWDDVNEVMYVRKYDLSGSVVEFFRYCTNATPSYCASQGANTWKQIASADLSAIGGSTCCEGIGWHPTLNGGTLLYYAAASGPGGCAALLGYRETTGTWSVIDPGTGCKFPTPGTGGYYLIPSTVKGVVMFGGGVTAKWWKIDGAGTITALADQPNGCHFGTTNGTMSQGAADPTTGDAIFIGCTTSGQVWRLNPDSGGTWTMLDANLGATGEICNVVQFPTEFCGADFYATSISTYGVIGYWKYRIGTPNFAEYWIYKPTATSGDVTPPTVSVTAPTGGATVSTTVTLSATASDNIGVVGVQFKVDGTNVGTEDTTSPYSISWDSTTVTNGTHSITAVARDAAGNGTTSSAVSVTVTNAGGGADFATRCAAAGVLFCNGFDSVGDLGGDGWGNARGHGPADGTVNCGVNNCPTIDTTNKVSGAGSLKFTIPPGAGGAPAGAYWANPAADFSVRFGAGQTYYVQFRQKVTASFFPAILGGGNGKIHWVSTTPDLPGCSTSVTTNCFASCTENEFVNQNNYGVATDSLPRWYNGCPGNNTFEFIEPVTPGQYKLQNARTGLGCTYDNVNAGNRFPPKGNCFPYYPDQWVTYSYKISLGSLGTGGVGGRCYDAGSPGSITPNLQNCYYGSQIQARMGLDGQPLEEVLNWTLPVVAKDQTNPTELKYGKVYFAPYTGTSTIPSGASMWFDELIISTQPIADPSTGTSPHVFVPVSFKIQ